VAIEIPAGRGRMADEKWHRRAVRIPGRSGAIGGVGPRKHHSAAGERRR